MLLLLLLLLSRVHPHDLGQVLGTALLQVPHPLHDSFLFDGVAQLAGQADDDDQKENDHDDQGHRDLRPSHGGDRLADAAGIHVVKAHGHGQLQALFLLVFCCCWYWH